MLDNYDYEEHNVSMWVSEDGSYGSGNIVFINTDDWTKDDYNSLDEASDSDKYPLAIGITKMREEGDYINWYCSGMGEGLGNGDISGVKGYVPEGVVTDEIKEDLKQLGWVPVEWKDEHYG